MRPFLPFSLLRECRRCATPLVRQGPGLTDMQRENKINARGRRRRSVYGWGSRGIVAGRRIVVIFSMPKVASVWCGPPVTSSVVPGVCGDRGENWSDDDDRQNENDYGFHNCPHAPAPFVRAIHGVLLKLTAALSYFFPFTCFSTRLAKTLSASFF